MSNSMAALLVVSTGGSLGDVLSDAEIYVKLFSLNVKSKLETVTTYRDDAADPTSRKIEVLKDNWIASPGRVSL